MGITSTLPQLKAHINQQNRSANHNIALAFCVDTNYLPYALFVAQQFIEHHPNDLCDICICLPDISQVPSHLLSTSIRFVELQIDGMDDLPVGKLSLAAYHRLFLPQIFAQDYDYILYLDADTYIMRPFFSQIMQLIQSYPKNFAIAAAADISELQSRYPKDHPNSSSYLSRYHQLSHIYRNSGVLVFNTSNYLEQEILPKVFKYAFENIDKLQCHDQSALNGALLDKVAMLPFTFNWQVHSLTYELTDDFKPYIIHFISDNKPWRLTNRYTTTYQNHYQIFIKNNFSNLKFSAQTEYQKRLKEPKYKNPLKELISKNNVLIKEFLESKNIKLTSKKNSISSILKSPPFS